MLFLTLELSAVMKSSFCLIATKCSSRIDQERDAILFFGIQL